ncbi:subunit iv of cytochrome bc complex petd [Heliomicrobium modesticaldum Ice1]|uniref:Subunit iv of cytochrome bc complex petd n=1 Tax=Heliobacterium modesticaldum (strain ATCC 51547 / Ice1) TaxID=498761 RepID=B0TBL6_HELMI|nr:subunit iv of cytochrome bc complex petd [Heliomicrobium modesticaldum]ABZ83855.1 subunit iv of cytochrome bc complex petd [Heliomicrobium modesticaldum Ice1]
MDNQKKRFTVPFIPVHITTEAALAMAFVGILFILSGVLPKEMAEPADKLVTPIGLKPEWYYLWAYVILEQVPNKLLGITIPGLMVLALFLVPWLERSKERHPAKRPIGVAVFTVMMIVVAILTYMGATLQIGG